MQGTLHKGDRIPSERELSETLHIGRSTLREAIKVLVMLGLLEIRNGQGTYITDGTNGFYTAPLEWGLIIGHKSIAELVEIRTILDCEAAYLATKRADKTALKDIKSAYLAMMAACKKSDTDKCIKSDVDFHLAIAKATGNTAMYQMMKTIRRLLEIWIARVLVSTDALEITFKEHEKIYKCICLGDAEGARTSMREHVDAAGMRLKKVSDDL